MTKKSFKANHASLLQQKHDNAIKNIQELQELEKYMFQNLQKINKADSSAANEAVIIQQRINELSTMRENLFTQLKNMYTNVQSDVSDGRKDLADQIAVVEIVEKELSAAKSNLNQLIQERDNKLRMVEIGEYTTARYRSHKDILKTIVYGVVVVILITLVMSFSWFPRMVGAIGIIATIAVTLSLVARELMDNWRRSNLVWSQFEQPYDKTLTNENKLNTFQNVLNTEKKSGLKLFDELSQSVESRAGAVSGAVSSDVSDAVSGAGGGGYVAELKNEIQSIANQAQANQGQVLAKSSETSEGFAPF